MPTGLAAAIRRSRRLIGTNMRDGNEMKSTLINRHLNWIVTLTALTLAVVAAAGSAL